MVGAPNFVKIAWWGPRAAAPLMPHVCKLISIMLTKIFSVAVCIGWNHNFSVKGRRSDLISMFRNTWSFSCSAILKKHTHILTHLSMRGNAYSIFHATFGRLPYKLPPPSLNTAHSWCKPSFFMSLSTFCPSLPFPPLTSSTRHVPPHFIVIHTPTFQMPKPPINLPRLTISAILCTPRRLYKFTLRFLSFSDTPHIHLTIIRSVLSRLCRFAFFVAQVAVPYTTQALYIFPFTRYNPPMAVRIGDNSLNFAQAHLTLALAASSTPPPAPRQFVAQIAEELGDTLQLHIGLNHNLSLQNWLREVIRSYQGRQFNFFLEGGAKFFQIFQCHRTIE